MNELNFNPKLENYVLNHKRVISGANSKDEAFGIIIFYFMAYFLIATLSVLLPMSIFLIETEFFDFLNLNWIDIRPLTFLDLFILPPVMFYYLSKKFSSL